MAQDIMAIKRERVSELLHTYQVLVPSFLEGK